MPEKKKLFVSVPMKDRTEEAIKNSITKMHKMAELILTEELELIESYVPEHPADNKDAVKYLGEAIEKMSEADYVIGLAEIEHSNGCLIEREVALRYGIPYVRAFAEQVAPDIIVALQRAQQNQQTIQDVNFDGLM